MSCDLGEFTSAYKCLCRRRRRVRDSAQSTAKPSGPTENLFLPNVFKNYSNHTHKVTFGRNGVIRYFRNGGTLKGEKIFQGRSEGV